LKTEDKLETREELSERQAPKKSILKKVNNQTYINSIV